MGSSTTNTEKFFVGQLVEHTELGFRAVIFDVDPDYCLSDDWYLAKTIANPNKDQPWYHVLVDDSAVATYAAEEQLKPDSQGTPINHPLVGRYFDAFAAGRYLSNKNGA